MVEITTFFQKLETGLCVLLQLWSLTSMYSSAATATSVSFSSQRE